MSAHARAAHWVSVLRRVSALPLDAELITDPALDKVVARVVGLEGLGPLDELGQSTLIPLASSGVDTLMIDLSGLLLGDVMQQVNLAWVVFMTQGALGLVPGQPSAQLSDLTFVGARSEEVPFDLAAASMPALVEDELEALLEVGFAFRSLPFDSPWRAGEPEADLRVLIDRLREAGDERGPLLAALAAELTPTDAGAGSGQRLRVMLGDSDAAHFALLAQRM